MIQELVHGAPPRRISGPAATVLPASPSAEGGNLVRFWELRGRRVFQMHGAWWGHHRGPFYTSLPFQVQVDLGPDEAREILLRARIGGLSFPSPRPGLPGGHYVIRPEGYGLGAVSRKQRGHVTRGLEDCELRLLDEDELLHKGMPLNRETLARQMREDGTFQDPAQWRTFVRAVGRCPGMAIHGAFVEGRLATYLISCRDGQWLHLITKMSSRAEQDHYPNHALDFSIIRDAAGDPGIRFIGNGMTSLLPNEGLDRYKRQLGYQVEPHNLRIHLHPWASPLVDGGLALAAVRRVQALLPDNARLAYYTKVLEGARITRRGG